MGIKNTKYLKGGECFEGLQEENFYRQILKE